MSAVEWLQVSSNRSCAPLPAACLPPAPAQAPVLIGQSQCSLSNFILYCIEFHFCWQRLLLRGPCCRQKLHPLVQSGVFQGTCCSGDCSSHWHDTVRAYFCSLTRQNSMGAMRSLLKFLYRLYLAETPSTCTNLLAGLAKASI